VHWFIQIQNHSLNAVRLTFFESEIEPDPENMAAQPFVNTASADISSGFILVEVPSLR
jgi:hypothetical protein